ncbi:MULTISPECIES: helix-turn-helix domain-containing protein [unclassified Aurantimonas]|uniref:helix-turn-helix domain-containing protein n=1 Tax=unclassified Aurantimonas TaxID=2638230 RepID=UPI002E17E9DC|nr:MULTISPECIES: helix-turn-helix domain-containing protein [unclassified Aurantimonas]MEC5289410.1 helix-turn-helix domain-containing protein [Aurantimonas sp. C2-3-R2]MEC5410490.1 helix-turn-helix domain-containing protein [Aurantimonas sp. C2-4-R8]
MNMDLMQLEAFLDARCETATEQANRHLSEKARHEDEAQIQQEIAVFCDRAASRVRGLREYLLQAPSGLAIEISATVKAEPSPAPAPVDERADPELPGSGMVSAAQEGNADGDDAHDGGSPAHPDTASETISGGDEAPSEAASDVAVVVAEVPAVNMEKEPSEAHPRVEDEAPAGKEADAGKKPSRAIDPVVIDRMAELWDEGKTIREIAEATGLTKGTVAGTTFRLRDRFPKRGPVQFQPKAPAQSPMEERLVPRMTSTPEAGGLTEDDQRLLDVMRMNRDRRGVCGITAKAAAEIAGLNNSVHVVGGRVRRLVKAGRMTVTEIGNQKIHRVSDKGGVFPTWQASEPSPMAERMVPRPAAPTLPANPKAVASLADRLLAKFADASAKIKNDTVMFGREFLIEFAGAAKGDFLPVDHALAELGSRREIEVTHRDKANVTVRLLKIAEAAE